MTKRELTQYYYLTIEIENERRRLAELELSAAPERELDETREIIKSKLRSAELMKQRTTREIYGIADIFLRQIFLMRHVDLMSWAAIAVRMGGDNTPDGVRMAHDRYIKSRQGKKRRARITAVSRSGKRSCNDTPEQ